MIICRSFRHAAADANKGNFGRVLIIAGSRGMSGRGRSCARSAALRGGAGLVQAGDARRIAADRRRVQSVLPDAAAASRRARPPQRRGRRRGRWTRPPRPWSLGSRDWDRARRQGPGAGGARQDGDAARSSTPMASTAWPPTCRSSAPGTSAPFVLTPHPGRVRPALWAATCPRCRRLDRSWPRLCREHGGVLLLKGQGNARDRRQPISIATPPATRAWPRAARATCSPG